MDYFLNRASIIGLLEANAHVFFKDNNEQLATITLLTPIDSSISGDSEQFQKHRVLVEDSLWVEYVISCLSEGNLVFVEGELDQTAGDSGSTWIVVSKKFGTIHPIHSHVHIFGESA
ncbi:MAG: hypothetical protein ABFQ95_05250 [Pseudomonadota bacterium]